jgi:universal stress protein E
MRRFKSILLIDSDRRGRRIALDRAHALARANEARLTVARTAEDAPNEEIKQIRRLRGEDLREILLEEARRRLDRLVASLGDTQVVVDTRVLSGKPFVEIIREVREGKHDLVMVPADGDRAFWMGTTVTHLLRKCPVPVWVLRPVPRPHYVSVLAAVDPDPDQEFGASLTRTILELASSMARDERSRLHVVHTWQFLEEALYRRRFRTSEEELAEMREEKDRHHREHVEKACAAVDLPESAELHVLRGDPAEVIPRLTREHEIDLVVMGTVARRGLSGILIGNTAEKVLGRVRCAVLAVKPGGFVSPVQFD